MVLNESAWNRGVFGEGKGNLRLRNTDTHSRKTWEVKKTEIGVYYNHGQGQRFQGLSSSPMGAKLGIILGLVFLHSCFRFFPLLL